MERTTALQLFEIYKLQKNYGRNIYPEELRGHNICSGSRAKSLIEELKDVFAIEEENVQGANTYRVTNIGIAQLESYLDLKRQLPALQATS